ncbi:MAG: hypothetical protein BGO30_06150 [Bacteroidetes bacterium 41-46]|jgi:3-hydroxyacyl-[acyl-carrier-protein] dehydratase|nr:MAG: hypothetical protein BGO30_06150 [Bacteroidetes bacterium 41-46]
MKIENLYSIDKTDISAGNSYSEEAIFKISLNPESEIFKGHFPGTPVLPGVCTMEIVKDCTESLLKREIIFTRIPQCKFTGMVDPNLDRILEVKITAKNSDDGSITINAVVFAHDSGRAILKFKGYV